MRYPDFFVITMKRVSAEYLTCLDAYSDSDWARCQAKRFMLLFLFVIIISYMNADGDDDNDDDDDDDDDYDDDE